MEESVRRRPADGKRMTDDDLIKTGNRSWGYYGTLRQQGHDEAVCGLLYDGMARRLLLHGMTPEQTVVALDSRWGRHLADWIGGDFAAKVEGKTEVTVHDANSDGLLRAINSSDLDRKLLLHWRSALRTMAGFWVPPVEEEG